MDTVVALLNVSFDKLSFAGGVAFVLVSIFCTKAVRLGSVQLPAIDPVGRGMSATIGIVLLLWVIFIWSASATVGLFSTPPKPSSESGSIPPLFFSTAYAAEGQALTLEQYHPLRAVMADGEEIGLYADNIQANTPSRIVVFRLNEQILPALGKRISYASLIETIGRSAILLEASVTQGGHYTFTAEHGAQHTLHVEQVLWYVFGADYMVVSLT